MGVLVRVDVRDLEAGVLQLLDLRERFALDFVLADGAAKNTESEVCGRVAKGAAVRTEERRDGRGIGDGCSVDEQDVAADAKGGPCESERYSIIEGSAGGHQGCGRDGTGVMELGDGAVDAGRETEVVRVDDEASLHKDETRMRGLRMRSGLCESVAHELTGHQRAADYALGDSRACARCRTIVRRREYECRSSSTSLVLETSLRQRRARVRCRWGRIRRSVTRMGSIRSR